jgi:Cu2+-exporting ATPase
MQSRAQHAARNAAELLHSFAPSSARVITAEGVREVRIEAVAEGDRLQVRAGEHVPADGVVVEGHSTLDASLLTGESLPREIGPGDEVCAGTINLAEPIVVTASKTGSATRVGRLLASVEEAALRRAPIALAADRAAGRFVVAALGLAVVTALGWWRVDPARAIDHAIALLVVTCPCALGLATPLAVSAAIGKAARRGVLVKGGDALEKLGLPSLVVFDKTGTLTEGRLELTRFVGDRELGPLVAAAEACSAHPLAHAFVRALGPSEVPVERFTQTPGGGIEACVGGRELVIGSVAFVSAHATLDPKLEQDARQAALEGETPILVAADGAVRALACFADPVRKDAAPALRELVQTGHRVAILSGDQPAVVAAVAARLGVELAFAEGGASPEHKLAVIEREAARGPVVMIGDGVNDAAALAAATVGVAVHGGAEASLAAADVFTTQSGVRPVVGLFRGAARTLRVIRRNMLLSLGYNLVCATLAVAGLIAPWIAAILMPLSSLTVVTSSYRSKTFEGWS